MEKKSAVVLQYNGRAPKGRNRLTGQWSIAKAEDKTAEAVIEEVKGFLAMARKDFFVHRGEGLEDAAYADESMEAEAKPIHKAK